MTPEPRESRALAALTDLLRGAAEAPTAVELERGLSAMRSRMRRESARRRGLGRSFAVAAAVGCVLLAGVALYRYRFDAVAHGPAVAVHAVQGGKILDGGYLSASASPVKLVFNEGSTFELAPGSRGRLRTVSADGARFAIEQGTGSFAITRNPEKRWAVEAGPFLVTVRGTDFSITWDPEGERFELELRHGRVLVSGPVLGEELALRGGQSLAVNLRRSETVITEGKPAQLGAEQAAPAASVGVETLEPVAAPAAPGGSVALAPVPPATASGERRWREALAGGQWDRVLADAERDGVERTLQTASSDDLLALADAARYRRRVDLARNALLAHRRRFPGSVDTSFLLGRVEELRAGGKAGAVQRYDEYLSRAPGGTYAAEALGRKLILVNELGGVDAARPVAKEYLRRFPRGSYAGPARAIEHAR